MRLLSTFAASVLAASSIVSVAAAAPISDQTAVQQMTQDSAPIEKTQFFFGGRNYCFYPNGWRGPGWYWCGYAWRRGFGWGGPRGWHGWRWRGGHRGWRGGRGGWSDGRRGGGWSSGPRGGTRGGMRGSGRGGGGGGNRGSR